MSKKIEKQIFELASLINSSLDIQTVLENAMRCAEELMRAEASSIFLIDETQRDLYFRLARGKEADKIKRLRIQLGEGVAGWVAQTGEPLIIPEAALDQRFNPHIDALSGFQTHSILCVPLKSKGRLIGVIQVLNKKSLTGFNQSDQEMLTLLANQIAIALENARSYQRIEELMEQVVHTLSMTTEIRDPYTAGHQRRVSNMAGAIGNEIGLSEDVIKCLKIAGLLHDIGKIVVPAEILSKPGRLSDLELALIKTHSQTGFEILKEVKFPWDIATIVLQHHERLDGSGYPAGLRGEEIILEARIIAVADVVEATASHRPYRPGLGTEKALEEVIDQRKTCFDSRVVDAFVRLFDEGFTF